MPVDTNTKKELCPNCIHRLEHVTGGCIIVMKVGQGEFAVTPDPYNCKHFEAKRK